jgi:hypothetical protein
MNKNETVSLSVSDAIQHIGLDQLKPHPRNEEIYGCTESIADLVELIQLKGYVQPLTVKTAGSLSQLLSATSRLKMTSSSSWWQKTATATKVQYREFGKELLWSL